MLSWDACCRGLQKGREGLSRIRGRGGSMRAMGSQCAKRELNRQGISSSQHLDEC